MGDGTTGGTEVEAACGEMAAIEALEVMAGLDTEDASWERMSKGPQLA